MTEKERYEAEIRSIMKMAGVIDPKPEEKKEEPKKKKGAKK